MRRREFIAGLGSATAAGSLTARAQQKLMPVIGFLSSTAASSAVEQLIGVRQGLGEAGFVEDRNLTLEYRWADGAYDQLPAMAAGLVSAKVDLIIAQGPPAARAAKAMTTTIPIVFGVGADPVAEGLITSLARPGGNLTGVSLQITDLVVRRLALIIEMVPDARLVALLMNPNVANPWISSVEDVARTKGVRLMILRAATAAEIDAAIAVVVQERAQALVVGEDPFLALHRQVVELALRHRIPAIGVFRGFAEMGGLVSYGASLKDAYRLIGNTAAKILKGAKPADLAVQQPTKFEMVLNVKTAKALGLTIAPLVLAQADEVIE